MNLPLSNLIMRIYELKGGAISIDGVNITYGRRDATREEIVAAAKAACCDHFIRTLEHGYDTIISSETANVSQGQIQLLTIARSILTNPSIIILDEAASNVDTRTELEIQKALSRLMKDKTSFVIAHRLSTIQNSDMILVVKDEDIVEREITKVFWHKMVSASLYYSQFEVAN